MTLLTNIYDTLIEWLCYYTGEHVKQKREQRMLRMMEMVTSNIQNATTYAGIVACEYQLQKMLDMFAEQRDYFYLPLITAINRKRLQIQNSK